MNETSMPLDSEPDVAISRRQLIGESPIMINEIFVGCLYAGLFGTLDSVRIKRFNDSILEITARSDSDYIILNLSSIEIIDSAIANHILRLNKTLQLVGVHVIFCGIQPIVAQSMVNTGVILENITVMKNLKKALDEVYAAKGYKLVKID